MDERIERALGRALFYWQSYFLKNLFDLRKPIVERVAGAAHRADRVLLAAGIEQFAQTPDVHVDRALVDIDVAAPDAVEQLLAREHAAGMLEEEFEQAIFGRPEIDGAAGASDTSLLAIEFDVA